MFRLLHMPTGLICYQFTDEKDALNALKFLEDSLKDKCTIELYSIEKREAHTIAIGEFTIIEDESKCLE